MSNYSLLSNTWKVDSPNVIPKYQYISITDNLQEGNIIQGTSGGGGGGAATCQEFGFSSNSNDDGGWKHMQYNEELNSVQYLKCTDGTYGATVKCYSNADATRPTACCSADNTTGIILHAGDQSIPGVTPTQNIAQCAAAESSPHSYSCKQKYNSDNGITRKCVQDTNGTYANLKACKEKCIGNTATACDEHNPNEWCGTCSTSVFGENCNWICNQSNGRFAHDDGKIGRAHV